MSITWASATEHLATQLLDPPSTIPAFPGTDWTRTDDRLAATAALAATYAPLHLSISGRASTFDLRLMRNDLASLQVSAMSLGADVALVAPPAKTFYLVVLPLSGAVTLTSRGESVVVVDDTGAVTDPEQPVAFENWTSDFAMLCVRIERPRLYRALASLTHRPIDRHIRFSFPLHLTAPSGGQLLRTLILLAGEMDQGTAGTSPIVLEHITELIVSTLLLQHPHDHGHLIEQSGTCCPDAVRVAEGFMQAHLGEDLTVADVAAAANVSVRQLETTFQHSRDSSPMTVFRAMRLARAHQELTSSSPDSVTVASVARRWGFHHHGRFAIAYRKVYGVSPSERLRSRSSRIQLA